MKSIIVSLAIITLSLTFAVDTYAEIDFETARGIWLLNEGKGDDIEDISGNDNHGELQGGKWIKGPDGPALSLNGVNDRVIIARLREYVSGKGVVNYFMGVCQQNRERFWPYSR